MGESTQRWIYSLYISENTLMQDQLITTIVASLAGVIGAIIGALSNIYLARMKTDHDTRSLNATGKDALRDDLFELVDNQDKKIASHETRIETLLDTIGKLHDSNDALRKERLILEVRVKELELENARLERDIKELQDIVSKLENKVWYKREAQK